jgi:hypothetical protein
VSAENGSVGVWKAFTLFLAGVVLTLSAAWMTATRDAVSREEMKDEIGSLRKQNEDLDEKVNQLRVQVAAISEHLGVPQATPPRR